MGCRSDGAEPVKSAPSRSKPKDNRRSSLSANTQSSGATSAGGGGSRRISGTATSNRALRGGKLHGEELWGRGDRRRRHRARGHARGYRRDGTSSARLRL